jgi:hypothetical protein
MGQEARGSNGGFASGERAYLPFRIKISEEKGSDASWKSVIKSLDSTIGRKDEK